MSRIRDVFTRYPLLRGMVSYSILWPTSAFIQQKIVGKSWSEIDWAKCARFSFYGGLYVAPMLYTWIRVSSKLFPQANLRTAVCKVWFGILSVQSVYQLTDGIWNSKPFCFIPKKGLLEQVSYTPAAMTSFYFLMSLLEGRSIEQAINEVKTKFWPTYKVKPKKEWKTDSNSWKSNWNFEKGNLLRWFATAFSFTSLTTSLAKNTE